MFTTQQLAERYGSRPAQITRRARQRGVTPSGRVGKMAAFTEAQADALAPRPPGRPRKPRCPACGK